MDQPAEGFGQVNPNAPPALSQFAFLIGRWHFEAKLKSAGALQSVAPCGTRLYPAPSAATKRARFLRTITTCDDVISLFDCDLQRIRNRCVRGRAWVEIKTPRQAGA
jgi:hypothetical protein